MSGMTFNDDGAAPGEGTVDARLADLQGIYGDNGEGEQDAMLDTSYSPPERCPRDIFEHETFDQRLADEQPEIWAERAASGEGPSDNPDDTPDDEDEVGDLRAGRLVAPDEGVRGDHSSEMLASDVGIDGGAASAEEAAMHVIGQDDY